jgi:hypothetical protein
MIGKMRELRMNKLETTAMGGDHRLASRNRRRIAVERNHLGAGSKDGRTVTARTECTVEDELAGRRRQCRKDFSEKNRNVTNRSATGIS